MSDSSTEIRDAVIKLEVKLEQMADSIATMASAIDKLADIKVEIQAVKLTTDSNHARCRERQEQLNNKILVTAKDLENLSKEFSECQQQQQKNTWTVSKMEAIWGTVAVGALSFIIWLVQSAITIT